MALCDVGAFELCDDPVDSDADGIGDTCDSCVDDANADQRDADADGIGDVCECVEPSALELRPTAPPLTVEKDSGGRLVLAWEAVGAVSNVYRGTLGSLAQAVYDHAQVPGGCGLALSALVVADGADDSYWLVAAAVTCGASGEGSYGHTSFYRERPPADTPCP